MNCIVIFEMDADNDNTLYNHVNIKKASVT